MKRILVLSLIFFSISGISISQSGWIQKSSGTSNTLTSICMVDDFNGYIVGYGGIILKTTDGGENWDLISAGINYGLYSVYFFDKDTGFVTGFFGGILKTYDGGSTWTTQVLNYTDIKYMHFFNRNKGMCLALRVDGFIPYTFALKTENGGATWDEFAIGTRSLTFTGFFVDSLIGYFGAYGGIYKTMNGGNNLTFIPLINNEDCYLYNFLNANIGFMMTYGGEAGNIKRTTNGGINWSIIYQNSNNVFPGGYFENINVGYASGYSQIIKTTNGGQSWITQYSNNESQGLYDMVFLQPLVGLVVGENGIILKTTNGGEPLGLQQLTSGIPESFSLHQNYPNPFNPNTKIKFDVPAVENGRDRSLRMIIYDILGREVATLVNEQLKPGSYEVEWDGNNYASGIYFYQLVTEQFTETKRMVLIK